MVEAAAGYTVIIQLQLADRSPESPIVVQALDGGNVGQNAVDPDGTVSFAFQAGTQPGLYRVLVKSGGTTATLRFWVPDQQHPETNPPALTPDAD
jgi:hypothetical protein